MEQYYFIIIVVVILKILFWTFYFYVRFQRARQVNAVQRVIIVGPREAARIRQSIYNDRSAIINHAESISTAPPPYADVAKDQSAACPPTYDQAMATPTFPAARGEMTPGAAAANSGNMAPPMSANSFAMAPPAGTAASPSAVSGGVAYSGPVPGNGYNSEQFAEHLARVASSSSAAMHNMPAAATQPHSSVPVPQISCAGYAGQNPSVQ